MHNCFIVVRKRRYLLIFGVLLKIEIYFKDASLYLYTLIIGHKSCNILSILNKLKL